MSMNELKIPRVEPTYPFEAYTHIVEPLTEEDGGGYVITFPDLARLHVGRRDD